MSEQETKEPKPEEATSHKLIKLVLGTVATFVATTLVELAVDKVAESRRNHKNSED